MSKYDIPYSMKPTKKGKKKQSKYSSYIEENDTFVNRLLSSPAKKLIAYVTFFAVFAVIFITALRNSKHPEALDYELEVGFPDSREQNLIDETIVDVNENAKQDSTVTMDVEVDEIDILDSDDGEVQLAEEDEETVAGGKAPAKGKAKAKAQANDSGKGKAAGAAKDTAKAPAKGGKGKAPAKEPAKKAKNPGKGLAKAKEVDTAVGEETSEDYVVPAPVKQKKGMLDDMEFSEELKGMLSSGNDKLHKDKSKRAKQSRQKQITDEELVEKIDKLEAEKAKGRKKNAFKGENL